MLSKRFNNSSHKMRNCNSAKRLPYSGGLEAFFAPLKLLYHVHKVALV